MKKCFTINPQRTTEEFLSYHQLFDENIYQAIEIFYPYNLDLERQKIYTNNISDIQSKYPRLEIVMHLPHGPKNDLCDLEKYDETLKILKDGIKYTSQFNTKKLTLHLGYVNNETSRDTYINHIVKVLKDLCRYADNFNMNIMIENMPGIKEMGYSPDEILQIIGQVNQSNLKFIFDTGHANVSEYNPTDYIYKLKDYLYHLHFNDNSGVKDQHIRLGLGNIDFSKIFKALKEINYQELYCMEVLYNNSEDLVLYSKDLDFYNSNLS